MKPNLPLCKFPEAEVELTPWLERYLVSPDLGTLVDQLRLLHGDAAPARPLLQLLNEEELQRVVRQGLAALPREALAPLLACPEALLELQERVFLADESHWRRLAAPPLPADGAVDRVRQRLLPALSRTAPAAARRTAWPNAWAAVAIAASLLAAFSWYAWQSPRQPALPQPAPRQPIAAKAWGWNALDLTARGVSSQDHFHRLARAADEWFQERPEGALAVAERVTHMRAGCTRLVLSTHSALTEADERWLVEACRVWGAKLDTAVQELEAGTDPLVIRADVDDLVTRVTQELRDRAGSP